MHGSGEDQARLSPVDQFRGGKGIGFSVSGTGASENDVQSEIHPGISEPMKLLNGLFAGVVLVHIFQSGIIAAFHSDVEVIDSVRAKKTKILTAFASDILDGGIHGDGIHIGKIAMDHFRNLRQLFCFQYKGIPVLQKDTSGIWIVIAGFLQILLDLRHRLNLK